MGKAMQLPRMRAECTELVLLLLLVVEKEFLDVKGEAHSCNRHDGR
jgi:hypothetical protein